MCKRYVLLCALLWPCLATAGYDEAVAAYNNGDYKAAATELQQLAKEGNDKAQVMLGVMHKSGVGLPQDRALALEWFKKAAEHGNTAAQTHINVMLNEDLDRKAAEKLRLSAENGDPLAQYTLGSMYEQGTGVQRDNKTAAEWYRKAAEQGEINSQINLGVMYAEGTGVKQDSVQAYKWLNLAAASGNKTAIKNRDLLASVMTDEEIKEAQRLAQEWPDKRAKKEKKK